MVKEFRTFVLRGNAIDLAVGVVMGAAFGAVVTALVNNILMQLIAAIVGKPDFSALSFSIHGANFRYGLVINAVITLVAVAAALFFFVVKPVNYLIARSRREPAPEPDTRKCEQCLSVVPLQARRCAFCTSELTPVG